MVNSYNSYYKLSIHHILLKLEYLYQQMFRMYIDIFINYYKYKFIYIIV